MSQVLKGRQFAALDRLQFHSTAPAAFGSVGLYAPGDDTVTLAYPYSGPSAVDGGAGIDTLVVSWGAATANVLLQVGTGSTGNGGLDGSVSDGGANSVSFTSFEILQVTTGSGDDDFHIAGDLTGSSFQAGGGSDRLSVTGNVTLSNFVASTASIETLNESSYGLVVSGTANGDTLDFGGMTNVGPQLVVQASGGADSVGGTEQGDSLEGGAGNDTLSGNGGNDILLANSGNNLLSGGAGNDTLVAESGQDTLNGGDDSDTIYADQGLHGTGTVGSGGVYSVDAGNGDDTIRVAGNLAGSTLQAGAGTDYLQLEANVTLSNFVASTGGFENLNADVYGIVVSGTGSADTIDFGGVTNVGPQLVVQGLGGNDSLGGSNQDDSLAGGLGNDTVSGNAGNDILLANAGANLLNGGTGNDTLVAESGQDTLNGGDDSDTIYADQGYHANGSAGTGGVYNVDAGNGDDTIRVAGNLAGSSLQGGAGNDYLQLEANVTFSNFVASTAAIENMSSDGYGIVVSGTGSADTIDFGGVTNVGPQLVVQGLGGNDSIGGSNQDDSLAGGLGNDTLSGNAGNDILLANAGANLLNGGTGNDTLVAESGTDTLNGGDDSDTIYADQGYHGNGSAGTGGVYNVDAGNGDDSIRVAGNLVGSTLQGGAGNDYLQLEANVTFSNFVASTAAIENMSSDGYGIIVSGTGSADTIDFGGVTNVGPQLVVQGLGGNDSLGGSNQDDSISGGTGNDTINGNAGNDVLLANSGNNLLNGGAGNDTLVAESGQDTLNGGDDSDTIYADQGLHGTGTVGSGGVYNVDAGNGDDSIRVAGNLVGSTLQGGAGNDYLQLEANVTFSNFVAATAGIENMSSDAYNLTVSGTSGADTIDFSGVTNVGPQLTVQGQGGNDMVGGSNQDDILDGGANNDTATYANATDSVTVDLNKQNQSQNTVHAGNDYLIGFENLTGSGFADTLIGDGANNSLAGGAGADTLTGNGGADTLDGGGADDSMVGGAGNDTYIVGSPGDQVVETSGAGTDLVKASISYTLGANLENLTLTGNDSISGTGNGAANSITGNGVDNTLDGGGGADTLAGGQGNDTYVVDALDSVSEAFGEGIDTVKAGFNYVLGANVENLILTGGADLTGTGNGLTNSITGNTGDNTLDGGGGADTLIGGQGDDLYKVNDGGDQVTELFGEGADTVSSSISYTLTANVENLVLTGLIGLSGTGNGLNNSISGTSGNDTLDGAGGADSMTGGSGNDSYAVNDPLDLVTENFNEGLDDVTSTISYTLTANVENLQLNGGGGLSGTGNELANSITGGNGNDTLDGLGGVDTLAGGLGDDLYRVDDSHDVVNEGSGAGTDTVRSTVSYLLGVNVENLVLIGSGHLTGAGNASANTITGNDDGDSLNGLGGADTLIGGAGDDTLNGGAAVDSLTGAAGNDLYIVDSSGDVITELSGGGADTVQASVSYTLSDYIEVLRLTGTADLNGVGNARANEIDGTTGLNSLSGAGGDDTLLGYAGKDTLDGGQGNDLLNGGAGADSLIGGGGNDTFVVDDAGDQVSENANQGTDMVQASVSFTLSANVENLTLVTGAIDGTGNGLDNRINGDGKANVLNGEGGNDTLNGGKGVDTADYHDAAAAVTVDLSDGSGQNTGGSGTDTLSSIENLIGSGFDDTLTGNKKGNHIDGGGGNDTIMSGRGSDDLTGGAGNDHFVFGSRLDSSPSRTDRIHDLTNGDVIDLSAIDANAKAAGNQSFTMVSNFDGHAGELVISYDSTANETTIRGYTDNDGKADFVLLLDGDHHDFGGFVL